MASGHAAHHEVTAESRGAEGLQGVEFRVDVAREPGTVRVRPVGEVDIVTVGRLRENMEAAMADGAALLILDLRATTFLDSTGLRLAMEADAWAATNRSAFAIIAGPPAVQRAFDLAGLSARLPFVDVPRA